jgi:CNT family concentrative nucleoside transporter
VYIQMGIAAEFMMAASVMAIPGALVIAKIVYPEVERSETRAGLTLHVERRAVNALDAVATGAVEGLRVGVAASAVLIAVIACVAMLDFGIAKLGTLLAGLLYAADEPALFATMDLRSLSLGSVLGALFYAPALLMGVPAVDAATVGGLMGTKLVVNEFVAYSQMAPLIEAGTLAPRSELIATFALCGFANFGSVAILIGGVGGMAPERRHDLARVGLRAMLCGTLASYLAAALVGVMYDGAAARDGALSASTVVGMLGAVAVIVWLARRARRRSA